MNRENYIKIFYEPILTSTEELISVSIRTEFKISKLKLKDLYVKYVYYVESMYEAKVSFSRRKCVLSTIKSSFFLFITKLYKFYARHWENPWNCQLVLVKLYFQTLHNLHFEQRKTMDNSIICFDRSLINVTLNPNVIYLRKIPVINTKRHQKSRNCFEVNMILVDACMIFLAVCFLTAIYCRVSIPGLLCSLTDFFMYCCQINRRRVRDEHNERVC